MTRAFIFVLNRLTFALELKLDRCFPIASKNFNIDVNLYNYFSLHEIASNYILRKLYSAGDFRELIKKLHFIPENKYKIVDESNLD